MEKNGTNRTTKGIKISQRSKNNTLSSKHLGQELGAAHKSRSKTPSRQLTTKDPKKKKWVYLLKHIPRKMQLESILQYHPNSHLHHIIMVTNYNYKSIDNGITPKTSF